jgi:hypothetical protein
MPMQALTELRYNIGNEVSISRIEFRNGLLRVSIQSPAVLDVISALNLAMPDWLIAVDGAISTEARRGSETATILVQPKTSEESAI